MSKKTNLKDTKKIDFLSISEAHKLTKISKLKLRQLIASKKISAKVDNLGQLKIDLSNIDKKIISDEAPQLDSENYVDILFDEVEDLNRDILLKSQEIESLTSLVEQQDAMINRSMTKLEDKNKKALELSVVIQNAFELIHRFEKLLSKESKKDNTLQLILRSENALSHADNAISNLKTQNKLLTNLFSDLSNVSNRINELADDQIEKLISSNRKAFILMEDLIAKYTEVRADKNNINSLLDRSMIVNYQFDLDSAQRTQIIEEQDKNLEKMAALSDRILQHNIKNQSNKGKNILQKLVKIFWL